MAPQPPAGTNFFGKLNSNVNISMTNELGFATKADCFGNPSVVASDAGVFNTGCEMIRTDILIGNNIYINIGTLANPVWALSGGSGGVTTINNLIGDITIAGSENITVTNAGNKITVATKDNIIATTFIDRTTGIPLTDLSIIYAIALG